MRSEPQHQRKDSDFRTRNHDREVRAQECKRSSTVTGAGETSVTYDECDEQKEVSLALYPEEKSSIGHKAEH